jgi:S-(hydroxymethyl)glutathione dehydrogenase/alcohol dehydrogenase
MMFPANGSRVRFKKVSMMQAAVLFNCGAALRVLRDIELPALQRGQVHVSLSYSGVCHSQLMEVQGGRGPDRFLPHLLGHEGTGRVLAIGEGVTKVAVGDLVVLGWIRGVGLDAKPPKYRWQDQTLNAGGVTTFNSQAIVSENRCYHLPEDVPEDVGVLFGCAVPTGAGMVLNEIAPEPGTSAVVFGLGGIGLIALMTFVAKGCSQIIGVDVTRHKLDAAMACGATSVIDASKQDPVAIIRQLTGGAGADYAIDAAGRTETIEQAFDSIRKFGGLCVFASHPRSGEVIRLDPHDLVSGKRIKGSWGGNVHPERDLQRFAELYRQGKLPLQSLLTDRYSLNEVNEALDALQAKQAFRPLLAF